MAAVRLSDHLQKIPPQVRPTVRAAIKTVKEIAPKADEIAYRSRPPSSRSAMWKLVRYAVGGGNVVGVGRNRTGPIVASGNQLHAWSKRKAPWTVKRPSVHISCAYHASYLARFCWSKPLMVSVSWSGMPFCVRYWRNVLFVKFFRLSTR